MHVEYKPQKICAQCIAFDLKDGRIYNVSFTGGCNGNLQALSRLTEGMSVETLEATLGGIKCAGKPTSCSDQLVKAVLQAADSSAQTVE